METTENKAVKFSHNGYDYWFTFIDSTHFYSSVHPDNIGCIFHIDEFFNRDDENYTHVKQWLRLQAQTFYY